MGDEANPELINSAKDSLNLKIIHLSDQVLLLFKGGEETAYDKMSIAKLLSFVRHSCSK